MKPILLLFSIFLTSTWSAFAQPAVPVVDASPAVDAVERVTPATATVNPATDAVVSVVPFQGEVEMALLAFLERSFAEADRQGAEVIVIEMNTPGGRVDAAIEIANLILESPIPVYIFVNPEATSAGAIISLAAQGIYMHPQSQIGTAAPVIMGGGQTSENMSAKMLSYVLAKVRSICEQRGYDERKTQIALAMVDRNIEVDGVSEEGSLLTLTAQQSVELDFTQGIVENINGLAEELGISEPEIVAIPETIAETAARFLASTTVSSILLTLAFLGLFIEIRTPGFGVPGFVGGLALVLFFFGHMLTGLAGWESLALLLIGLILVGIEIFVIPGFGLAGIGGILCLVGSIVLALIEAPITSPDFPQEIAWEAIADATLVAVFSMLVGIAGGMLFPFLIPVALQNRKLASWLMLSDTQERDMGYQVADPDTETLVGKTGRAKSPLRPAGTADIEGHRYDVVTEGGFIPAHSTVEVVKVEGRRIIVRAIPGT